jgi:hypothetical protein
MRSGRTPLLLAAVMAALCSGCGAAPPQPPAVQAGRVASALSGISSACGEAYQQRAFATRPQLGGRPTPGVLEAAAGERAVELARVYRARASWIYQGQTITKIVAQAVHALRECGLPGAAARLERLTR